ncbi:MAG: DinB family protein [Proteobacteria bacterium]|nr:DinB family protein [Pseudomonadota bacterium]MBU1595499.1 DinB family protein [Pseudomonadota bacterium]
MRPTFATQARANRWANEALYAELKKLSPEQLAQGFGVNFGSILGIANHTILADRVWLARFLGQAPVAPAGFAAATDFTSLRVLRQAQDELVVAFAEAFEPARLSETLRYTSMEGTPHAEPLAVCLAQFFNHQTFHRGQIHALLGVLGLNPPDLDLIYYQIAHRDYTA